MTPHELRDPEQARQYVAQGLLLQRIQPPTAERIRPALEWVLELVAAGQPLPPTGFIADLGSLLFGVDRDSRAGRELPSLPGLPDGLLRGYEDFVLGKLYADWTFERAADAVRRYEGRDRRRGLVFVVEQLRERAGFDGVLLSPAVVKALLDVSPEELLKNARERAERAGWQPQIVPLMEALAAAFRRSAEALGPEDVFELEHRTALAELGQRVALRQTLQTAARFEAALPQNRVKPLAGRHEVPTHVFDEDAYPVGGFASLSNRGSVESLLHSQLAFMEPAGAERPDLFDVKFLRDELLYYSRDENQFLRRRRTFVLVLQPDLVEARFKDPALPTQRVIVALAFLVATVRKLIEWLSDDALTFEVVFLGDALDQERGLLEMLLREQIANGTVKVSQVENLAAATALAERRARRSLCHALTVGVAPGRIDRDGMSSARLTVAGPLPVLTAEDDDLTATDEDAFDAWAGTLETLLRMWV
ncbi:MAG: hypothetical protein U0746_08965 [Gemmataceae bacterium]